MEGSSRSDDRVVERLVRAFGPRSESARGSIAAFYAVLDRDAFSGATAAFERWQTESGGPYVRVLERSPGVLGRTVRSFGVASTFDAARLLFAMQTYYALLARLVTRQVGPGRIDEDCAGDVFGWCERLEAGPVAAWRKCLTAAMEDYDRNAPLRQAGGFDLLGTIYQELFPKRLRHAMGEYYTPGWLAKHVLDVTGYRGDAQRRLIDPACGSGVFLVEAIRRIRGLPPAADGTRRVPATDADLCHRILSNVVGLDANPLAVLAARANYAVALGSLMEGIDRIEIPVFRCDSILDDQPAADAAAGRFDDVVGNPPWIVWDHLPAAYREATKPLWHRYGLFNLSATEARHGGGKKDLSMLMLYVAADRYLADGGRLGILVTQTAFQSKGAGDGFRRFRLGNEGAWLGVRRVDDLVAVEPFPGAANWTAVVVLEKGQPTRYPLPYVRWVKGEEHGRTNGDLDFRLVPCQAQPVDANRASSPWMIRPEGPAIEMARLAGPSDYQAHLGANTGGANGVYWLELLGKTADGVVVRNRTGRGKQAVDEVECMLEPDLIYPLLRWSDVGRYRAIPSGHLLLVQDIETRRGIDPAAMRARCPRTFAYLERFADVLSRRAAYRRYQPCTAFYSMYNVGRYTVAPLKVVWRRMDRRINAAVVESVEDPMLGMRPVVPQETCVLVAAESADEAHYLAALLNSAIVGRLVGSQSVRGGKGFGTPSILESLRLRRFSPSDARHLELAALSREAHAVATRGDDVADLQRSIDLAAGRLWGLSDKETESIADEAG